MNNYSTCLRKIPQCCDYLPFQLQFHTGQRWPCFSHVGVEKAPPSPAARFLSHPPHPPTPQSGYFCLCCSRGHKRPVAPESVSKVCPCCLCSSPAFNILPSRLRPFTPMRTEENNGQLERNHSPARGHVKWRPRGKQYGSYKRLNIDSHVIQSFQF